MNRRLASSMCFYVLPSRLLLLLVLTHTQNQLNTPGWPVALDTRPVLQTLHKCFKPATQVFLVTLKASRSLMAYLVAMSQGGCVDLALLVQDSASRRSSATTTRVLTTDQAKTIE